MASKPDETATEAPPHQVHFNVASSSSDENKHFGSTDDFSHERNQSGESRLLLSRQNSEKSPLLMSSRELSVGINPGLGYRHLVTFMCFLGTAMNYALRVNLSVAIVAMVKHEDKVIDLNVTVDTLVCPTDPNQKTTPLQGEFDWDAQTQGIILSAFFYGALATQLLGGILADRFGGMKVFGLGICLTSVFTILTPPLARYNVTLLVIARVIEGLGEGMTVPAMYVLLSKWSPRLERTQFGAFAMAGCNVGNVLGLALTGLLADAMAGGWPLAFYTFGVAGLLWVMAWSVFVFESPAVHPSISVSERNYILVSTGDRQDAPPTPWRSLLTSIPLWAITAAHFGKNWVYFTLLTTLPSYMRQVLKFDISKNGVLSSVPYLAMWVVEIFGSQLLDWFRRRKLMSTTTARKGFNTIGVLLTVIFLVVEGYIGCNKTLAVVILSLGTAFLGLTSCGFQVNHLDIAPVFAGTLMGFTNNIATIPGIVSPSVVTYITEAKPFPERWRIVFYIAASVHLLGGLVFLAGSSAKEQPWARHTHSGYTYSGKTHTDKPDSTPSTSKSNSDQSQSEGSKDA